MKNLKQIIMLCLLWTMGIVANAEEIPNDEIWYEASAKLTETTGSYEWGFHTNVFNTSISSHTFSNGKGIIKFNADVTSIGAYAFYYCSLTSITIPNSVTSITNCAVYECLDLTSITIPNSVTSIGSDAFYNCLGLTSISVADGNSKYDSRDSCNAIIETSTNTLIAGCKNTTIPNSVTSIGDDAFRGCSSLTSITIPNSVTSIGDYAFYYCAGLSSITIPNSVTSIGSYAFKNCSGLTSITIPNSVTNIGEYPFTGCTSLPIENNLRYASTYLVEAVNKTLSSYSIKEGTNWVGYAAFYNCSNLTSITIPNSVTSIGSYAFKNCSGLTSITIPNSVTNIGEYAFSGCSRLPDENNIRYADTYLVGAVDNTLSSYTIKEGTKWIGSYAFNNCSNLTSITIPNSVTSIGVCPFSGCSSLTSIQVSSDNHYYDSRDNCNAIINTANNTLITGCLSTMIPNSVTSIGDHAFSGCKVLTSITIPNSVTSIGDEAFFYCAGLTSITIPNSLTSIGDQAFYGCSGLTSVTIGNSVTSIGYAAFYNCSSMTSITIPNSVTSIGVRAFYGCSGLTLVTIGNSVTSIGFEAFYNCSSLTSITIPNSVTDIGNSVFYGCSGLMSIKVSWPRPLSIQSGVFNSIDKKLCTLYVPKGTATMYMVAPEWFNFKNIVEYGGKVESVSMNKSEVTLIKGDNMTLTATVLPNDAEDKSLTWESSNPNVATVVDGVVTGVGAGTATITVTTNDGSELSASCEVKVVASNYVVIDKSGKTINKNIDTYDDVVIKDDYISIGIYEDITDVNIMYSRTFKNTNWQPLYVPFDMDVTSELLTNFSFAKYAGTYTEDDGTFCITIAKLNEGSKIKANTPYFIKAKVADSSSTQTISVEGTTLHATEENSIYMLSAEKKVTVYGLYNKKTFTAEEVAEKNVYGYGGGTYNPQTAGQALGAFRFYIKLTNREDNPYDTETPSSIKLKVLGEDDDATSIDALQTSTESDTNFYDLSGRVVSNPRHGVYIKNGKKYYVK